MNTRRKHVSVSYEWLEQLVLPGVKNFETFGLPETAQLVEVQVDPNRMCVNLVFQDESFPLLRTGEPYEHIRVEAALKRTES